MSDTHTTEQDEPSRRDFIYIATGAAAAVGLAAALILLPTPVSAADEHQYVGAKKCKTCHKKEPIGNQYGVWLDGKHANAFAYLHVLF